MSEEISREAKKGTFDRNPRLTRRIVCSKCGKQIKSYLEYLKEQHFEVGQPQKVVVPQPGDPFVLRYEEETVTPISIKVKCLGCGCEKDVTDPILTIEYLQGITKLKEPRLFFV